MSTDPRTWSEQDTRAGRVAYDEYYRRRAGLSVNGQPMWTWDEMVADKPDIAFAWMCAAEAAIDDYVATCLK